MQMKKIRQSRGFTLIELLVVIAIIGILSSIVLASLNSARSRGADAAIKSNLNTVRLQAEIFAESNNGSYGSFTAGICPTSTGSSNMFQDPTVVQAIMAATSASAGSNRCGANGTAWAVSVQLRSNTSQFWCVDSNGVAITRTSLHTSTSCS